MRRPNGSVIGRVRAVSTGVSAVMAGLGRWPRYRGAAASGAAGEALNANLVTIAAAHNRGDASVDAAMHARAGNQAPTGALRPEPVPGTSTPWSLAPRPRGQGRRPI